MKKTNHRYSRTVWVMFLPLALILLRAEASAFDIKSTLILELGNPDDSVALLKAADAVGISSTTPGVSGDFTDNVSFSEVKPVSKWFPGFDKGRAPDAWIKQWSGRSAELVYLSGHFNEHLDGSLWNNVKVDGAYDPNFVVDLSGPAKLKVYNGFTNKTPTVFSATSVVSKVELVVIVGCSAVGNKDWVKKIQTFFERDGKRPMLLGFAGTAPANGQHTIVKNFVENLGDGKALTDKAVEDAWLKAAKDWGSTYSKNVSFANRKGEITKVDP